MYVSLLCKFSMLYLVAKCTCTLHNLTWTPKSELKWDSGVLLYYILFFSCIYLLTLTYRHILNYRWKAQYHDRHTDNIWRTAGTCSGRRFAMWSRRHKPRVLAPVQRILEYAPPRQSCRCHTCCGPILWSQTRSQRPQEPGKEQWEQLSEEWTQRPNQPLFTRVPAVFRERSTITDAADKPFLDAVPNFFPSCQKQWH